MTMGRDDGNVVAGGLARHIPVLGRAALELLSPRDGGIYVDGTFGAGGHTRAILEAADTNVIAIDRDPRAIAAGAALVERFQGRLRLVEERFANLDAVLARLGVAQADGVLLDIGVSSMQLDEGERGFSFRHEGPLDMRMGDTGPTAADLIAAASERDLAQIIAVLGEERHARAVARAIGRARTDAPIQTTRALADIVARVVFAKPHEIHPATRTFQALRIYLNDELGELVAALAAAERVLAPGGRLVVISFHSLEDRIVKTFLTERGRVAAGSRHMPEVAQAAPSFEILTKRPVIADESENAANPRARSAKLRAAARTAAPAQDRDGAELLPRLPDLDHVMWGR
jgi:16S rRNA (cytosine1402-N4)-methyltransferase